MLVSMQVDSIKQANADMADEEKTASRRTTEEGKRGL
jgi:hypothetical protein